MKSENYRFDSLNLSSHELGFHRSMDFSNSIVFDIFELYRRYRDIRSGNGYVSREQGCRLGDPSQGVEDMREALAQLLKMVDSRVETSGRNWIFDDLSKLMSRLDLVVDSCQFTYFYDFVFFMCREHGQRSITVSRAVTAWRLVLEGRFRLLNHWCDFVEKNQRHNISEDTWRQVLAFSRCVREDLKGYDPEGAWPVLVDEFVEHMYRITGSHSCCSQGSGYNWVKQEIDPCGSDGSLLGLNLGSGSKRKLLEDFPALELELSNLPGPHATNFELVLNSKRSRQVPLLVKTVNLLDQETHPCGSDGSLPGLNLCSASKRKLLEDFTVHEFEVSNLSVLHSRNSELLSSSKRNGQVPLVVKTVNWEENSLGNAMNDCMEDAKSKSPVDTSNNSPCAVEGSLSKFFAGLLSPGSCLHFDRNRRVSI